MEVTARTSKIMVTIRNVFILAEEASCSAFAN